MRRASAISLMAAVTLSAGSSGVRPRTGASDYPARQSTAGGEFGAAVIPAAEVKKIFAADLNGAGYIVVEVGVFPAPAHSIDLSPLDFTLLTDPKALAERTADIGAIVSAAVKDPNAGRRTGDKDVYVTAGASIEHASYPDPLTGRRTGATAVGESAGIGVGSSGPQSPLPPQPSGPTRYQLDQQLQAKSLPEGDTTTPVAGYLYFPKPSNKAKNVSWALQWENASGRAFIQIQNPAK